MKGCLYPIVYINPGGVRREKTITSGLCTFNFNRVNFHHDNNNDTKFYSIGLKLPGNTRNELYIYFFNKLKI